MGCHYTRNEVVCTLISLNFLYFPIGAGFVEHLSSKCEQSRVLKRKQRALMEKSERSDFLSHHSNALLGLPAVGSLFVCMCVRVCV